MGGGTHHRLELHYRGVVHVHRWSPSCVCGWQGVHRRRRHEAEVQYHAHVEGCTSASKPRARVKPRRLTATDQLPDTLR